MKAGRPQPLEAMISRYLEVAALGERTAWLRADIALEARTAYGLTASQWAAQVGCSATWVRQMWRAAEAFPEPARIEGASFTLHALAAHSAEAQEWIERAHDEQWSAADLRRAMKGEATLTAEEQAAQGERILQRLRKWAEGVPAEVRREVAEKARAWVVEA